MDAIEISIDRLHLLIDTGISETMVFLGLGLNAAGRNDFVDYELSKLPQEVQGMDIEFVSPGASIEEMNKFKQRFSLWLTRCGFRDVVENFSLFLDAIQQYCSMVESARIKQDFSTMSKRRMKFCRAGIGDKLDVLAKDFDIVPGYVEYIAFLKTIRDARNCLVHRQGIVGADDVDTNGDMHITWHALNAFGLLSEGNKRIEFTAKIYLPEPGRICLELRKTTLSFRQGDTLSFSIDQIRSISFFIWHAAVGTLKSFQAFLKNNRIPLHIKS